MDNWINSCRKHPRLFERLKSVHFVDDDTLVEILKLRWKKHHEDVVKHIPCEKLLVFDIERDNAAEIDKFLGLDSKLPMKLKKANVSPGQTFALLNTITPTWIRRAIPKPIKSWVSRVTRQMP